MLRAILPVTKMDMEYNYVNYICKQQALKHLAGHLEIETLHNLLVYINLYWYFIG